MCGIFGIVTQKDQKLGSLLTDAGKRLSYRGYDSVGCATINQTGVIDLRKDVGKIDEVSDRLHFSEMVGSRGIVQLRWATFGHPSTENAQPHIDSDGDLVGAHNGNVVNNHELRKQFHAEGMIVRSTNDGESCVHAVERYLDQGYELLEAIRLAYNDLDGDYAFVIGRVGDDRLFAIKKGSGLVVGLGDNFTCISSDLPSLLPLTRQVIRIYDGEIVTLRFNSVELFKVEDGSTLTREAETVSESMESVQKGGYPHFMLKEIHEQPIVAGELLNVLDKSTDIDLMVEVIRSAKNVYLIGCGTSYYACMLGSVYLAQIAGITAIPVLGPQFVEQYAPAVSKEDVGIFVSQSGETKDVLNAVNAAVEKGMRILGMVNVIGSTLTQVSEHFLPLVCGYEISVPATKTFMNQLINFAYMAIRTSGSSTEILHNIPNVFKQTIAWADAQIQPLVNILSVKDDLYCLGYGATYPIALEGALKLKEITYSHCEGMLSTEFKHGPLSAVTDGYPVIFITTREDIPIIISGINEVTCRGGNAIVIGPDDFRLHNNAEHVITIPKADQFIFPLLTVLPLQLLAYHISIARGIDPDFPRNLSKTLTVD